MIGFGRVPLTPAAAVARQQRLLMQGRCVRACAWDIAGFELTLRAVRGCAGRRCVLRRCVGRYGEYGSDAAVMGTSADMFASTSPALKQLADGGAERYGCVLHVWRHGKLFACAWSHLTALSRTEH